MMSWGTDFKTDIFIPRESFNNKQEIQNRYDEVEDDIRFLERELLACSVCNIKDLNQEDPIEYVRMKVDELLRDLREKHILSFKLYLLKESKYGSDN